LKNEDKVKILTKKIFFLLGITLMTIACDNDSKIPKGAIDRKTMAKMLADIHLVEAKVSRMTFQDYDSTKVAYKELELQVMKKYKTDTATYRASYNYYVTNPELMTSIYDETLANLEAMRKQNKKKLKK
jgi:hypothetical protein